MISSVSIDWAVAIPVLIAAIAPTLTGFLQEYSKKFSETAPWYVKGAVTAGIAALIALITSYAASGDALLASIGGAVVGIIGTINITFRKGSRANLKAVQLAKVEEACDPVKVCDPVKGID